MIRYLIIALVLASPLSYASGLVRVPLTELTFVAPVGFTALSQDEIDVKFPSKTAPRSVVGNERRTTTVAYDVRDIAVTDEILEGQLQEISSLSSRAVPGFKLIEQGMKTLNGRTWAYIEFRSSALDADIRNILLMASYEGRMVVLNFNSTESDFVKLEPELRASISSLGQASSG